MTNFNLYTISGIFHCEAQGCTTSKCRCRDVANPDLNFVLEAQSSTSAKMDTTEGAPISTSESMSMRMRVLKDSSVDVTNEGHAGIASLEKFLERRHAIYDTTWTVGTALDVNFNPWYLFLNNSAVKRKIDNFHLLKGNLMLTFYINGTPFHQGLALATYRYWETQHITGGISDGVLCQLSQRPHVKLIPTTSQGGCLCVPFLFPQNYLDLQNPTSLSSQTIGNVRIHSAGNLEQINSGTDKVSINVFAQMVDPVLTAPTTRQVALSGSGSMEFFQMEAQSSAKDEYEEDGTISGPASTVAQYAGYLAEAPVIGPFALATQIGANAIGGIARLFGYSKPVAIKDMARMKNHVVSNMALCEGADMSQKLTLTAKQELSIDPRLVGMPGDLDEMSLKFLTGKESYVTTFDWAVTNVIEDCIFAIQVNPMIENHASVTGGHKYHPTSLSFISRMFGHWCGTLKFRFVSLSSAYHRGRIAAVYDAGGAISTTEPYNTTFNTVLDLQEARDFEVKVNWQQDKVWLDMQEDSAGETYWTSTSPEAMTAMDTSNGVLYIKVATELTVPDGTTKARFAVFVSAGEDFMLQNPSSNYGDYNTFAPVAYSGDGDIGDLFKLEAQGEDIEEENDAAPEFEKTPIELTANAESRVLERPFVCFGEVPTHLRQLLKRYTFFRNLGIDSASTAPVYYSTVWPAMPVQPGFDPDGYDALTGGLVQYNFVGMSPIAYLRVAYAMWRGSIRYKFLPTISGVTLGLVSAHRIVRPSKSAAVMTLNPTTEMTVASGQSQSFRAHGAVKKTLGTFSGMALTHVNTQSGFEIEIPYHLPVRGSATSNGFQAANGNLVDSSYPGGNLINFDYVCDRSDIFGINSYVAAGEDFCFHGFIGAPTLFKTALPTPDP